MTKIKIALLIGINYIGTSSQLNGCHNDVIKMKEILITHYNYSEKNIYLLIDKPGYIQPTTKNIISQFNYIYILSKKNIIKDIYIHYSGHGTNIIDKAGDEIDGKDECIVPVDYKKSGLITDDLIYDFLSKIKYIENKIIWVFDSCNSASCSDLPYSFTLNNTNQIIKQSFSKRKEIINNKNIFVLSGCLDAKVSYDVREPDNTPCGLLSYNLRKTLKEFNYTCTLEQLLTNIKKGFVLNNKLIDQTPVLSVNSNNNGKTTIIFEKPIQSIQSNIPIIQPIIPIVPLISEELIQTFNNINNMNLLINNFYIQFNKFNEECKKNSQDEINNKINIFTK
jgi:hypothetical protein